MKWFGKYMSGLES